MFRSYKNAWQDRIDNSYHMSCGDTSMSASDLLARLDPPLAIKMHKRSDHAHCRAMKPGRFLELKGMSGKNGTLSSGQINSSDQLSMRLIW